MDCLDRIRKNIDSPIEFRFLKWENCLNYPQYFRARKFFSQEFHRHQKCDKLQNDPRYFPLVYAIEGLLSVRGELFDYFFRPSPTNERAQRFYEFLNEVIKNYEEDMEENPEASKFIIFPTSNVLNFSEILKTITVLESMLQHIQSAADVPNVLNFVRELYKKPVVNTVAELTEE